MGANPLSFPTPFSRLLSLRIYANVMTEIRGCKLRRFQEPDSEASGLTEIMVGTVTKLEKGIQIQLKKEKRKRIRGQAKHSFRPNGCTTILLLLNLSKRQLLLYLTCILSFIVNMPRNSACLISHFPHYHFFVVGGRSGRLNAVIRFTLSFYSCNFSSLEWLPLLLTLSRS